MEEGKGAWESAFGVTQVIPFEERGELWKGESDVGRDLQIQFHFYDMTPLRR